MRALTIITSVALTAFIAFALVSPSSLISQQNATQRCQQLLTEAEQSNNAAQCQLAAGQVTWFSWLKGDSRSVQFHFFDLVELISSSGESSKNRYQNEYTE
ncbi:hypothetical protein [Idiomarina sp. HP20-50]|uniref:hypothetical protein n=1 Tax=Idiomarina sp. HP20-50 TaxID=3070813 RepID=UPI00294B8910|nr:hypothetical protein [Idiomarina sp. HP20-50]MDV6316781.1 hypothetical protein [Idiomarina sp. HP20-50]